MSATKIDDEQENLYNIDLSMPLKTYWQLNDLLRQADYLLAEKEQQADVQGLYKDVFKIACSHAIYESDRTWLIKQMS